MDAYAIISGTMLVVSAILAGAMATGWASLGRPRHALSWAIAYALYGGEIVLQIVRTLMPGSDWLQLFEAPFILTPATLVLVGARQRADLPLRPIIALAATLTAVLLTDLGVVLPRFFEWSSTVPGLFTATAMPAAMAAIRPHGRRTEPAEWAVIAMLAIFVLFELALVALDIARKLDPADAAWQSLFLTTYLTGLMPVFTANGVAAILLLASDLAARLRTLAANDPLTGVLNRRGFHEAAMRAVANGRRHRQSVSIALADIDHFKSINDRFGHTAGDRTLRFICGRLATGLRSGDLIGRIGGEEFAVLLVNSDAQQAAEAIERIRHEIAVGYSDDGAPVPVTSSFGVATVASSSGSADQLLAEAMDRADRALYLSKIEGRNRVTVAAA